MKNWQRWSSSLFVFICLLGTAEVQASVVCREKYIAGLEREIDAAAVLLGENTTDLSKMKLFVSKYNGTTYIQSNYLSEKPDSPGTYNAHPTKISGNEADTLVTALMNIVTENPAHVPTEALVARALAHLEVYVDRAAIDSNGRIDIDLFEARSIQLAAENQSVPTGKISSLRLRKPPPILLEKLNKWNFKGRPPGRGHAITVKLINQTFVAEKLVFLPFVVDSSTDRIVASSPQLKAAHERSGAARHAQWADKLQAALHAATGTSLVLLTHIDGANIQVRDPAGRVLFAIPVGEVRRMARAANANLILFGCETVELAAEGLSFGVLGKFTSATGAARLADALPASSNMAELLDHMASPEIELVAYDESAGNGYSGASAFAQAHGESFSRRVFRLLAVFGRKR